MPCPSREVQLTSTSVWAGLFLLTVVSFGCAPKTQTIPQSGYPSVSDDAISQTRPDIDLMSELVAVYEQIRQETAPGSVVAEADALAQEAQLLYLLGEFELAEEMLIQAISLFGDTGAPVGNNDPPGDERGAGDGGSLGDGPDR